MNNWRKSCPGKDVFRSERKRALDIASVLETIHARWTNIGTPSFSPPTSVVEFGDSQGRSNNERWIEAMFPLTLIVLSDVGGSITVINNFLTSLAEPTTTTTSSSSESRSSPSPTMITWSSSDDEKLAKLSLNPQVEDVGKPVESESSVVFPTFVSTVQSNDDGLNENDEATRVTSSCFPTTIGTSNNLQDCRRKLKDLSKLIQTAHEDLVSTIHFHCMPDVVPTVLIYHDPLGAWKNKLNEYIHKQSVVRGKNVLLTKGPEFTTQNLLLLNAYGMTHSHSKKTRIQVQQFIEARAKHLCVDTKEASMVLSFYVMLSTIDTILAQVVLTQDLMYVSNTVGEENWKEKLPYHVELYYLRFVLCVDLDEKKK